MSVSQLDSSGNHRPYVTTEIRLGRESTWDVGFVVADPDEARLTELFDAAATTVAESASAATAACSSFRASSASDQVLSDGGAGGARTRDPGIMSPLL